MFPDIVTVNCLFLLTFLDKLQVLDLSPHLFISFLEHNHILKSGSNDSDVSVSGVCFLLAFGRWTFLLIFSVICV